MTHDLRLLTFDRYETYLRPLARRGHQWDVAVAEHRLRLEPWQAQRLYSDRARMISPADARKRLARGDYDAVICHGPQDLAAVADTTVPAIVVFHGTRELEVACGLDWRAFRRRFDTALERARRVFINRAVRKSWQLTGDDIAPAIDIDGFAPYEGDLPAVLTVGDFDAARALLSGGAPLEQVLAGLRVTLAGINPPATLDRVPADVLREAYRRHAVFAHITRAPFDTGCPMAIGQAMAAGMPIVTVAGPATPVVDGISGLVAETASGVRERCLRLLEERDFARTLGANARIAAAEAFGPARFLDRWDTVLRSLLRHDAHDAARTEVHAASR